MLIMMKSDPFFSAVTPFTVTSASEAANTSNTARFGEGERFVFLFKWAAGSVLCAA